MLISLCSLFMLFSCRTNEEKAASDKPFSVETFKKNSGTCQPDSGMCAYVDLQYWKATGKSPLANSINRSVSNLLSSVLGAEVDISKKQTGFDKAAKEYFEGYGAGSYIKMDEGILTERKHLISVQHHLDEYGAGAAHNQMATVFELFDKTTGRKVKFQELVTDSTKLLKVVEAAFRKKMNVPPNANLAKKGFELRNGKYFFLPTNIGLTDKGVFFHYNPYEIAAFVVGGIDFEIPYEQLKPYLKMDKLQ